MSNKNFFLTIFIIVLITFRYCTLCYSPKVIDGVSMSPTLHDGDVIYASEIIPKVNGVHRGDIVGITKNINNTNSRIIKRVIGLPREHVVLNNGKIYINDNILLEPYLDKNTFTLGDFDYQLHDNQYIVLGDNRSESMDSRDNKVGIISRSEIDFVYIKIKTNLKE